MSISITVNVISPNGEHVVELPQSQNKFDETLCSMQITKCESDEYTIVSAISTLEIINKSLALSTDIEEINFLSLVLDGFLDYENEIFDAIVEKLQGDVPVRHLINISCNIFNYDIDTTIKNLQELGARYVINKMPFFDKTIFNNINLIGVGKDLFKCQSGEFTKLGYIKNFYQNFENSYNGSIFPDYDFDDNYILKVTLSKKDSNLNNKVSFTMPATKNVIARAMHRLNVDDIEGCQVTLSTSWDFEKITELEWDYDFDKLNRLIKKVQSIEDERLMDYLNTVKRETSITSIDDLYSCTDFFIFNSFAKHKEISDTIRKSIEGLTNTVSKTIRIFPQIEIESFLGSMRGEIEHLVNNLDIEVSYLDYFDKLVAEEKSNKIERPNFGKTVGFANDNEKVKVLHQVE